MLDVRDAARHNDGAVYGERRGAHDAEGRHLRIVGDLLDAGFETELGDGRAGDGGERLAALAAGAENLNCGVGLRRSLRVSLAVRG